MSKTIETRQKLNEAMHLQAIEDNPLDAHDKALFEMFDRNNLTPDERRAHILAQANALKSAAD